MSRDVIDLTSPPSASPAGPRLHGDFFGRQGKGYAISLAHLSIGERLGASRDGGEGYQGCNSRVFRATLRRQDQPTPPNDDAGKGEGAKGVSSPYSSSRPGSMASFMALGGKRGREDGSPAASSITRIGEQLWNGSFGACFSGSNYEEAKDRGEEAGAGEQSNGTEWALKMALTLAGQDPQQAAREMETEIAILVGGRISPHANIMRGVHSFEDVIGEDLKPVLWDGLGPNVGETLSPRTFFITMPLFRAGSLQALLNKRRTRREGPPFLRLLDTMRFGEQMLSAVCHLLDHGVAHNDIKPDNWLLGADQQTLVLTDFGSAVDALRPEGRAGSSWHATPTPAAPVPPFDAPAAAVAARPNPGEATVAGRVSSPCRSAQATGSTAVGPAARGEAGEESSLASTVRRFDPESKPSSDSVAEGVDPASRARKRRRFCGGGEDQQGGESARGNGKEKDKPAEGCSMSLSEKLVFPYSNYLGTGAPAFVAPELARAWREKSVLDFRHSDVFSVGLCMYRMLRPDSVDIDNGTGLEGKGRFGSLEGRFGQQSWPLPEFPENRGGCPTEVAALVRSLLHADPYQRQEASEGLSLVSWYISQLEPAQGSDAHKSAGGAGGAGGADGAACGSADVSRSTKLQRQAVACQASDGSSAFGGGATIPPPAHGGDEKRRGEGVPERDAVVGRALSAEDRHGQPDELIRLIRSDRISHMRECFERASPDDLFLVLDTSGWDVQAACAVFQDSRSGESVQGGRPGKFVKGAPPNDSLLSLLFDNVAEGLQRRRRVAYPSHLRQPVDATRREMPSSSFSM